MDDEVVAESRLGETWRIRRDGNHLTFRGFDGTNFEIGLHETAGRSEWQGLIEDQPYLTVLVPKRRVFRLDQTNAFTLLQWLGLPGPEHLRVALSRRFRGTLVVGLLWVVMALIPVGISAFGGIAIHSTYNTFVRFELIEFVFVPWLCVLARLDVQQYSYFQSVTTDA